MPHPPLLDRQFLEKLERLTIHWKKSFPGLIGGHHLSRLPGTGQEFFDHRTFHHGDDLRAVNWRAYLRLEKMFLKLFQVEPRIPLRLLLDTSNSMGTRAGGQASTKFDFARKIAGALCYVGLVRLDAITLQPFSDRLHDSMLSSGGRHRFGPVADFLNALEARGITKYYDIARQFAGMYPQRGLLIIISDFLDDHGAERALHSLADLGHELLLIHVYDEEDREPPWDGELELIDSETNEELQLFFDGEARRRYTADFDAFAGGLSELALAKGGRYVGLCTRMPAEDAVFGPLIAAQGLV